MIALVIAEEAIADGGSVLLASAAWCVRGRTFEWVCPTRGLRFNGKCSRICCIYLTGSESRCNFIVAFRKRAMQYSTGASLLVCACTHPTPPVLARILRLARPDALSIWPCRAGPSPTTLVAGVRIFDRRFFQTVLAPRCGARALIRCLVPVHFLRLLRCPPPICAPMCRRRILGCWLRLSSLPVRKCVDFVVC